MRIKTRIASRWSDLPLDFHPAAIRVSAGFALRLKFGRAARCRGTGRVCLFPCLAKGAAAVERHWQPSGLQGFDNTLSRMDGGVVDRHLRPMSHRLSQRVYRMNVHSDKEFTSIVFSDTILGQMHGPAS